MVDTIDADERPVWATVQLARNLRRPRTLELIGHIADEFIELHGDRLFGDDPAMVAGLARIAGRRVVVVGQQKGAETDENIRRNFGMPHPEGYRKAMRLMELAERLRIPVITFIDVPGAHPGPESEERGIAEAIARSIALMSRLRTPIVAVITGEGGSGGALAIAVGDVVIALENAVYSVISPEGCASILWRTPDQAATGRCRDEDDRRRPGRAGRRRPRRRGTRGRRPDRSGRDGGHAQGRRSSPSSSSSPAQPLDELIEARYRRYRSLGPFATIATVEVPPPERPGLADRLRQPDRRSASPPAVTAPLRPRAEPQVPEPGEPPVDEED